MCDAGLHHAMSFPVQGGKRGTMDSSAWLKAGEVILGGALGGTATVFGLSRWLGEVWLGRILEKEKAKYAKEVEKLKAGLAQELERYRTELDRSIFVTRAQFETEFAAMKQVSQALSGVKVAFLSLHPLDANVRLMDAERTKRIDWLKRASDKYLEKLEEWAVFLEPPLYDEFDHAYAAADAEWKRLKTNPEDHDRAGTVAYFWKSYRQACQMVRDRIKSLAVIPRT
jgi:hypothetical protein